MTIRARAPLRLGLAGGGTDVSPYCDTHGGRILNVTIDRYAYAVLQELDQPLVRFVAADHEKRVEYALTDFIAHDGILDLHKAVYNEIVKNYNGGQPLAVELTTFCDAPAGSGLGSSSTIVVAMIRAYAELLNLPLDDYLIASIAYKVERVDCALQGGRQDQYAATFGGFNFMEFDAGEKAVVNPLRIKNWIICELEASLVLFYTGVSRESAGIIAEQASNVTRGNSTSIEAFHKIKEEAVQMKESLLKGEFGNLVESMRMGWESKKKSAAAVSNEMIERIYLAALNAGASAGKISGAGGGGFMMFFVPPDKRMNVCNTLARFGGSVSNVHFTKYGAQAWRVK